MQTIRHFKAIQFIVVIFILITAISAFVVLYPTGDVAQTLRSSGYDVNTKDSTFRGFVAQKISADKDSEQVIAQIIKGVTSADSQGILRQLNEPVQNIQQKVVLTDPYTGRQQELSVPESLKPVREDTVVKGIPVTYFIVYANDILSMKIFSEAEVKYRGLFSTFYCPKEKAVRALEIYSDIEHFDKQKQLSTLSSLLCNKE